jgi:undecaprenyl-diphosphatase
MLKELDSRYGARIRKLELVGAARATFSVIAHSGDVFVVGPALVLLWLVGDRSLKMLAVLLAGAAVLSVSFIYVIKFTVRRNRPPGDWGGFYRRNDPYSFPSGHAAKTMTLAIVVLGTGRPLIGLLLLPWSILVGFSRVALGVHYLSDITVGYLVGIFAGATVIVLCRAFGWPPA